MNAPPLLELAHVGAAYGLARILFDLSFTVGRGEIVALLGRNGAGKSTTLKTILGLVDATQGEVRFDGRRINGLAPSVDAIAAREIFLVVRLHSLAVNDDAAG